MKRQVNGRISWSAIMVPVKDPSRAVAAATATQYKVYILVYKDRSVIPGDEDSQMIAAPVLRHASDIDPATLPPLMSNAHGGYQSAVNHVALEPNIPVAGVFKDNWVMLVNSRPPADADPALAGAALSLPVPAGVFDPATDSVVPKRLAAESAGYRTQVSFAKLSLIHI